jgi:hypothetical protein
MLDACRPIAHTHRQLLVGCVKPGRPGPAADNSDQALRLRNMAAGRCTATVRPWTGGFFQGQTASPTL